MKVEVKKLGENVSDIEYATDGSAGVDLRAYIEDPITIAPGERAMISTGVAVAIPDGFVGLLFIRSGIARKNGVTLANSVGVIDSDYRGELKAVLSNGGTEAYTVSPGERIVQLIVTPYVGATFSYVEELSNTSRGSGGFGHTGKS